MCFTIKLNVEISSFKFFLTAIFAYANGGTDDATTVMDSTPPPLEAFDDLMRLTSRYNALYAAERQADTEFRENLSMHHNDAREKRNEWVEAHVAELEDIADRLVRMKR